MLTNVYTPLVGGVTRSIQAVAGEVRRRGHRVLIIAPRFGEATPGDEEDVVRIPALPNMYRQRYAWPLPIPGFVHGTIRQFGPDVIHTHHPFLLGAAGQRQSALWDLPLVYTHHTRYRMYMERALGASQMSTELLWSLTMSYCDLCDVLIAPSRDIASMLEEGGVERRIEVIPTGVDFERFRRGDGRRARRAQGIPEEAFVVGSVSRLEPEKNWDFLARTAARYLKEEPRAHFLAVGDGELAGAIRAAFRRAGVADRLHAPGTLEGQPLVDAYHAMDVFAFASHTETQGLVVTEAMAAGLPVVAIAASGVRDVVADGHNGRLLDAEDTESFLAALRWAAKLDDDARRRFAEAARRTAADLSIAQCAGKILDAYRTAIEGRARLREADAGVWPSPLRFLRYQWQTWSRLLEVAGQSLVGEKRHAGRK
jgi:1,2-diacylglycerol 3-alpha-glucosyltransferase